MIQAKINNFRGIKSAALDFSDTITVIGADNGEGKSSTAQALAAAATGNAMPFDGMTKKDAEKLIYKGEKEAKVTFYEGVNGSQIRYPQCEYETKHDPIVISDMSAGLKQISGLKPAERIQFLTVLLDALPSKEQLNGALDVKSEWLENIWKEISINGWDNAVKIYEEKRLSNKLKWQEITGEKYGSKKADGWTPASWDMDLMDKTEAQLTDELKQADEWVDAAIRSTAISDDDKEKAKVLVESIPELEKQSVEALEKYGKTSKALADVRKSRDAIPMQAAGAQAACPQCGTMLIMKNNQLLKHSDVTPEKSAENDALRKQADDAVVEMTELYEIAQKAKMIIDTQLQDAKQAAQKPSRATGSPEAGDDIDKTKQQQETARRRLADALRVFNANKKFVAITVLDGVINALKPNGIRKDCIEGAFKKLNAMLTALSGIAKWAPVQIEIDGHIRYGDIPFSLLAESEQYRVNAVFQVLISGKEKSRFMIIDRADCLLPKKRDGLMKMVARSKIPTAIFMALPDRESLPVKISKIGGRCYWIENQEASEING